MANHSSPVSKVLRTERSATASTDTQDLMTLTPPCPVRGAVQTVLLRGGRQRSTTFQKPRDQANYRGTASPGTTTSPWSRWQAIHEPRGTWLGRIAWCHPTTGVGVPGEGTAPPITVQTPSGQTVTQIMTRKPLAPASNRTRQLGRVREQTRARLSGFPENAGLTGPPAHCHDHVCGLQTT